MGKLFIGRLKVDDQVTEFDMSELTAGKLTLPTGAIKNLTEIDAGVLLGIANMPQAGGGKLVQEKHLVDSIDFAEQGRQGIQADVDANEAAALAGRNAIQADVDQNEADADASFVAAATDRALVRSEFAAADVVLKGQMEAYADQAEADAKAEAAFNLAAEAVIARAAEAANAAAIGAEEVRALGQEAAIRSEFAAADALLTAARAAGDQALQDQFDTLLAGSGVDLDTLLELVTAYELSDTGIIASIVALQADVDGNEADADASFVAATSDRAAIRSEFAAADATELARATAAEALNASNLVSEEAARIAADGTATTDRAAVRSEFAAADLAEQTARIAADGVLQGNIDAEAVRATAAEGVLTGNLAQELLDRAAGDAATLVDAKAYTDTREAAESAARIAADSTLTSNLAAQVAKEAAYEVSNDAALAAEVTNRMSADAFEANLSLVARNDIQADVDQNEADADASFTAAGTDRAAIRSEFAAADASALVASQAAAVAEQLLRIGAENAIQADVDANEVASVASFAAATSDRAAVRSEFAAADASEAALRVAGDANLQGQMDALMAGSTVDLDTLVELVAAYELADTSIVSSITTLQSDVDANELYGDTDRGAIRSEFAAADALLQTALDDEEARATAAEAVLSASISTEMARAMAAEAVNAAAITAEEAARIAAASAEQTLRIGAEAAIQADVDANEAAGIAAAAAEQTLRIAAEAAIQADVDANEVASIAADNALTASIGEINAGKIGINYLTEVDSAMGIATHYIVNASSAKTFTIPTMAESHYIMVKVAEGSKKVTFAAGSGESIDGESDGEVVLHGGTSVMFAKKGGVMYMF